MTVYTTSRIVRTSDRQGKGPFAITVYATARNDTSATTTTALNVSGMGQVLSGGDYRCGQYFITFDTSSIPVGTTSAILSIANNLASTGADTLEVREVSSSANMIAGDSLASYPLLGSAIMPTIAGRIAITLDISGMSRTSATILLVHSQKQRLATAPTGDQSIQFSGSTAASTEWPYLDFPGPWSIVGVGTVVEISGGTNTQVLTEPAGCAAGDLLVACIASRMASTSQISLPSGWTRVNEQVTNNTSATAGSAIGSGMMAYIVRGASAPALSFGFLAPPSVAIGRIVAYRGNAAASPLDVSTAGTTGAVTAVSVTGLTTTQDDDLIVALAAGGQEATWSAFNATTPAGASGATNTTAAPVAAWTERAESITTTGADTSLAIFDAVKATTGATGNLTVTASIASGHVVVAGAFKIFPAVTAKTLPAVAGTYALTGTVANLERGREVEALAGSYALTGQPVTLSKVVSYRLASDAGAYALSGATAGLYRGREVLAVAGSYGLSGTAASLEVGREAAADPGSYALTGTATSLELGKEVLALAGTYAVTGATATLRHGWKIAADGSSYALTGAAATLTKGAAIVHRTIAADPGAYALTGAATSLELGREVLAVAGSHALTGTLASLEYGREIAAVAGSYALTGTAATLRHAWKTAAVSGSYAITGTAAAFARTWKTTAVAGSYSITGTPANLLTVGARAIIGLPGSYALTGAATSLEVGREVAAVAGSYSLLGAGQDTIVNGTFAADTGWSKSDGTVTISGGTLNFTASPVNSLATQAQALVAGTSYRVVFTISGFSAGTVRAIFTGGTQVNGTTVSGNGTYTHTLTAATGNTTVGFQALSGSNTLKIDTVSLATTAATSLLLGRRATAVAGSYALSGAAATFLSTRRVTALSGSYSLSGLPANLLRFGAYAIIGLPGAYTLSGSTATLSKTAAVAWSVIAEAGSYRLTGSPVALIWSGEGVPVTPPGGMPWYGRPSGIPKKELRKAIRELLAREEKRKKRRKPKEIAKEIIAAIEPQGLGVAEKRIVTKLISQALLSQLPQMFYSQPLIHDKGELARAILFIIERAMQRILDEEEDEEAALLLLSAA